MKNKLRAITDFMRRHLMRILSAHNVCIRSGEDVFSCRAHIFIIHYMYMYVYVHTIYNDEKSIGLIIYKR